MEKSKMGCAQAEFRMADAEDVWGQRESAKHWKIEMMLAGCHAKSNDAQGARGDVEACLIVKDYFTGRLRWCKKDVKPKQRCSKRVRGDAKDAMIVDGSLKDDDWWTVDLCRIWYPRCLETVPVWLLLKYLKCSHQLTSDSFLPVVLLQYLEQT